MNLTSGFSIKVKVTSAIVVVALMTAAFIVLIFPRQQERQAFRGLTSQAISIAEMLAYTVSAALEFDDSLAVQEAFESAKREELVSFIEVYDLEHGRTHLFSRDSVNVALPPLPQPGPRTFTAQNMLVATVPVVSSQRTIGTLMVGLSLHDLRAEVRRNRTTTLIVSLLVALVGLAVGSFISKRLTAPIVALRVCNEITESLRL